MYTIYSEWSYNFASPLQLQGIDWDNFTFTFIQ
jgi:hypothetical protein